MSAPSVMKFWTFAALLVLTVLFLRFPWMVSEFIHWFSGVFFNGVAHPHPYQIAPGTAHLPHGASQAASTVTH